MGFGEQVLGESYTDEVRAVMESVRDYPVTIAKSANATGKTHGAARVAAWWYKAFEGSQVYVAAAPPEDNLRRLLWGEIMAIMHRHPKVFDGDKVAGIQLSRSPLEFVAGVTIPSSGTTAQREAKFSGKHAPHLLFILDEADAIPDEVFRGIWGCMSGGHARMLCMFNPRAELGEVYRMERDGQANVVSLSAFSHPNVITGEDRIPGAVTRETTVRRINEWCRPLAPSEKPGHETFEIPEYLVGETALSQSGRLYPPLQAGHYRIMQPAFAYMVLGQYPAQAENQLISREWTAKARSRWDAHVQVHGEVPPEASSGIAGLDVAEFGSDANSFCPRYGGYVGRLSSWGGVDTVVTADLAAKEAKGLARIAQVNIDATGLGAGVAPLIQRDHRLPASGVKVANSPTEPWKTGEEVHGEFYQLRDQLYWRMREWLRTDPGAMLPPDEQLLEELHTPTYSEDTRTRKVRIMDKDTMREMLQRSPDRMESLMLTFFKPDLLFPDI